VSVFERWGYSKASPFFLLQFNGKNNTILIKKKEKKMSGSNRQPLLILNNNVSNNQVRRRAEEEKKEKDQQQNESSGEDEDGNESGSENEQEREKEKEKRRELSTPTTSAIFRDHDDHTSITTEGARRLREEEEREKERQRQTEKYEKEDQQGKKNRSWTRRSWESITRTASAVERMTVTDRMRLYVAFPIHGLNIVLRYFALTRAIAESIGVPTLVLARLLVLVFFLVAVPISGLSFLAIIVAVPEPLYQSMLAYRRNDAKNIVLYLQYWLLFGLLTLVDGILQVLFTRPWHLALLKIALFLYMHHPRLLGCSVIYAKLVDSVLDALDAFVKATFREMRKNKEQDENESANPFHLNFGLQQPQQHQSQDTHNHQHHQHGQTQRQRQTQTQTQTPTLIVSPAAAAFSFPPFFPSSPSSPLPSSPSHPPPPNPNSSQRGGGIVFPGFPVFSPSFTQAGLGRSGQQILSESNLL
jgi:hypothetical protein